MFADERRLWTRGGYADTTDTRRRGQPIPAAIPSSVAATLTGQLDSETGRQTMRLLRTVVHAEGVTALVATHDPALMTSPTA